MIDDYQRLLDLMPPPPDVTATPWDEIAGEIELPLPGDYKWFCATYGGGRINQPKGSKRGAWFEIFAPSQVGTKVLRPGLQGLVDYHMRDFYEIFYDADESIWPEGPLPVYPEPGGVLAWGQSEWGDSLFWSTADPNPDNWPVVAWMRHTGEPVFPECGMVEFLLRVFREEFPMMTSWLTPGLQWTMRNDWSRQDLEVTAGPARE